MVKVRTDSLDFDLKGKTIAFATDTVFGIGALLDDAEAINKIFHLKKRDYSKPLAVLVSSIDEAQELVNGDISNISKFWPGAVTFILPKRGVSDLVTSGYDTVGIRIPNSKVALRVLSTFGPMAVTSVNLSGESSATTLKEILNFDIDYVVVDDEKSEGIPSTVVDLVEEPVILRQGSVSLEELKKEFPNIKINE